MVNDSSRLFERSSATAIFAAPGCRHARSYRRRGNGDGFDCRALSGAALHDGLHISRFPCANGSARSIRSELSDGGFCRAVVPPCTYLPSWQRRRFRLPCALRRCSSRRSLKHLYFWVRVRDGQRFFASIRKELGDGDFCRAVVPTCTQLPSSWQRRRLRLPCALRRCSSRRPFIFSIRV